MTEAEKDQIAAMVLQLVQSIVNERETRRPPLEKVGPSPVYQEYERLIGVNASPVRPRFESNLGGGQGRPRRPTPLLASAPTCSGPTLQSAPCGADAA